MRILLDTHALLWFLAGDARTPAHWRSIFEDVSSNLLPSTDATCCGFPTCRLTMATPSTAFWFARHWRMTFR